MIKIISLIMSILISYTKQSNALPTQPKSTGLTTLTTISKTTTTTVTTTTTTVTLNLIDLQLHNAAWNGNYTAVQAALKAGANVNSLGPRYGNYDPTTPLFDMMNNQNNNINITNLLISAGANLTYQNIYGYTALIAASRRGYLDIVKALIKANITIDTTDTNRQTALMGASLYGFTNIMTTLISSGANVNKTDASGRSALTLATITYQTKAVTILVDAHANPNIKDAIGGNTPMMWSAKHGYLPITKELCMEGGDINAQATDTNKTALMFAAQYNQAPTVSFLLRMGCSVNLKDTSGYTALKWATAYRHNATIVILLKYNATL